MDSTLGLTYFWLCAALAVIGAIATVANKNPIRGAMGLLLLILSVAGLFFALHAQFLGVIQLIVYAGAIIVLFLFVIMLLGPSAVGPRDNRGIYARAFGGIVFLAAAIGAMALVLRGGHAAAMAEAPAEFGSVDAFGRVLFSNALVPFELSSALLMIAVIGAVAVARGKQAAKLPSGQTAPGVTEQMLAEVPTAKKSITADTPGVSSERRS